MTKFEKEYLKLLADYKKSEKECNTLEKEYKTIFNIKNGYGLKPIESNDDYPKLGQYGFVDTRIDNNLFVKEKLDPIKPKHYNSTKISTFDIVNDWGLNFFLGNVVKYIQRAGKKEGNSELQDLKKANEYLTEYIKMLEVE